MAKDPEMKEEPMEQEAVDPKSLKMSPGELLEAAATLLEAKRGPRAPKTYDMAAAEVRALAARIAAL